MLTYLLTLTLYSSLAVHLALGAAVLWRLWRGKNALDRLVGVDLIATLTISILTLTALIERQILYIDVALGLAALGFLTTIALARYIEQERVF